VLTELGAKTKEALLRGMNAPPPELLQLAPSDLETLRAVLQRLPAGSPQPPRDGAAPPS
jgi:hypothetical protein